MKFKMSLLICSMVIISLIAISAVSASDEAADVVEMSDIDEVQAVESVDVDEAKAVEADDAVSQVEEEPIAASNVQEDVIADGESGNGSGNGSGSGMDMSSMMGGMDMSSMMGGMDWASMFGGGSSGSDSIQCKDLTAYYAKTTSYKVTVLDSNKKAIAKAYVTVKVNGKSYTAKTNSKGVATLKLKLKPGKYTVIAYYGQVKADADIVIKDVLKTKNAIASTKKGGKFTVKVLNKKGKAYAKQTVAIQFNKKIYKIKTNKKGIATFKIPKKLKKGKYTIKTNYNGLTKTNKVLVQ